MCRLAETQGQVSLDGADISSLSPRRFAQRLTIHAQQRPTPTGLTVAEVVELGRHPHRGRLRRGDSDGAEAVERALVLTELEDLAHRPVTELSGGQLQRVWLATCLAQQTDVLLLDEPTTFLDLKHQMSLLDLIRDLADVHGLTIGVVLHDLEQAADIADHVVLLAGGRRPGRRCAGACDDPGAPERCVRGSHRRRADARRRPERPRPAQPTARRRRGGDGIRWPEKPAQRLCRSPPELTIPAAPDLTHTAPVPEGHPCPLPTPLLYAGCSAWQ